MYRVRTPGYSKRNPAMRWTLPDRVFFACGACHILAHAFLQRHGRDIDQVLWIRPAQGHTGNHIVIARGQTERTQRVRASGGGGRSDTCRPAWWRSVSCTERVLAAP